MLNLIWLSIAAPLAGVLINGLFGRWLGKTVAGVLGSLLVLVSFVVGLLVFAQVPGLAHHRATVHLWTWAAIGDFSVDLNLLVDPLSMLMVLVVTGVGFLIHVYAVGYMDHDQRVPRFFTYLNLFIASMLILVLSDNYLGLYVGWELVGFCSYLLIGFWFFKPEAADAGKKAFIVNRIGDFGFALGVFLIWSAFGTLNFQAVFEAAPQLQPALQGTIALITALLFVGAVGKSAQIPLYVWLPDAMEGPTPVSALIHAATMVTAGVYMIARSHILYALAPQVSLVVAFTGGLTALYAATIALAQFDLKRVLAYSTISQLGYMVMAVGVGAYASGLFHLVTHAFFKALLFLAAGSVMHALHDVIDIRRMGGLKARMPVTHVTFVIGGLALAGFPLLSGFFSKDEILARAFAFAPQIAPWAGPVLYLIGLVTALLTAFYIFRAIFVAFYGQPRDRELYDHAHENPPVMTAPLWILAALSVVGGLLGLPAGLGLPNWIEGWLEPTFEGLETALAIHPPHLAAPTEVGLLAVSSAVALLGIGLAYLVYVRSPHIPVQAAARFPALYNLLARKYYVDEIYEALFVRPGRGLARFSAGVIDKGLIDFVLVDGSARLVRGLGGLLGKLQSGYLRHYATATLIG
ncbi:MAG: NADH-quinone oxidoreductase subunit L, partial [Anaerolineae bacterium]